MLRTFIGIVIAAVGIVSSAAGVVDSGDYAYYVPARYDASKSWPIVYVFEPVARGALAAELFRAAAEEHGWIVVASNRTRNGMSWDEVGRVVGETSQSASKRFRIDSRRVYTAGFSGGAMIAWWLAQRSNAVAGVIACGSPRVDTSNVAFDWFGFAGIADFNNLESRTIDANLGKTAHRLEIIDGNHRWANSDEMRTAVAWMEVQAMKRGTRAKDDALVARLMSDDVASAERGDELERMRRYEAIARTYDGLANVDDVRAKARALAPAAAKLAKQETAADDYDRSFDGRLPRAFNGFVNGESPRNAAWLANELQIAHLRKAARADSYRGLAAQRVLARIRGQLRMLAEDLDRKKEKGLAGVVRDVMRQAAV